GIFSSGLAGALWRRGPVCRPSLRGRDY
ncbi:uncharacterized protein METZ01_LOCUS436221, partial [marine metagenome]